MSARFECEGSLLLHRLRGALMVALLAGANVLPAFAQQPASPAVSGAPPVVQAASPAPSSSPSQAQMQAPPSAQPTATPTGKRGKPALTVQLVKTTQARLPTTLSLNGNVAPWQEMSVGSELSAVRLQEVHAQVGDRVKKGQLLAQHSTESIELDLALAQAALAEAQAAAAEAARNADALRALTDTAAVSGLQQNQVLTQELTTRARAQSAAAQVDVQRLRLKQARVLAPDDGIITARTAVPGAVPLAGQELFRMLRKGRLEWRGEVTAQELGRIRPGMPVVLSATDGRDITARVRTVGPTIDTASRTALVYADLPESASIPAGAFVRGVVRLGESMARLLPESAVVQREGYRYVFVLASDGQTVRQTKVETGRRDAQRVEILSGLDDDAQVVSTGAGFLADGDVVRVVP